MVLLVPDLERLANTVSTHLGNLTVDSSRCTRVRSPLSKCRACLEVCPTGGISWNKNELQVGKCIECGLCATACPSGALEWKYPSPEQLINKLKELVSLYQEAYIYCSQHTPKRNVPWGTEVSCFGSIPWECWLAILQLDDKFKLAHPENSCHTCRVTNGEKLWQQQLQKAENLAGKKINVIEEIKPKRLKKKPQKINRERRQLFALFVSSLGKIPENMVNSIAGGKKETERIVPVSGTAAPRRKVLLHVLQNKPHLAERITISLPVINEKCQFCKACSILCPRGALQQTESGGMFELRLDKTLCSGCGLCTEVCYHNAVELTKYPAATLTKPGQLLISGGEISCPNCGFTYASADTKATCPKCKNRGNNYFLS